MSENKECGLCLGAYDDPRFLSCGHSFCLGCVQVHSDVGKDSLCPLCRKRTIPKTQRVDELPKNFALVPAEDVQGERKRIRCPVCGDAVQRHRIYRCKTDEKLACLPCHYETHDKTISCSQSLAEWHADVVRQDAQPLLDKIATIASLSDELGRVAQHTVQLQKALDLVPQVFRSSVTNLVEKSELEIKDLKPPSIKKEVEEASKYADDLICSLSTHIQSSLHSLFNGSNTLYSLLVETLASPGTEIDWNGEEEIILEHEKGIGRAIVNITGAMPRLLQQTQPELFQQPNWDWKDMKEKGLLAPEGGPTLFFLWIEPGIFPASAAHLSSCELELDGTHKDKASEELDFVRAYCFNVPSL